MHRNMIEVHTHHIYNNCDLWHKLICPAMYLIYNYKMTPDCDSTGTEKLQHDVS